MNDAKTTLEELVATLSRERDELRVQMQLAKQELRDKWEPLEDKWGSLEARLRSLGDVSTEAGKEVATASKALLNEIGEAYKDIWKEIRRG